MSVVCLLQLRVKQRSVGNVSVIAVERLLGHYIHVHKAKWSNDKISVNSANYKLSLAHPQATVTVQITVLVHGGRNISKCSSHHNYCAGVRSAGPRQNMVGHHTAQTQRRVATALPAVHAAMSCVNADVSAQHILR